MRIYKFRDFNKEVEKQYFLQIVLDNVIWCAKANSLYDEKEFKSQLNCEPSPDTRRLLSEALAKYRLTDCHLPNNELADLALKNKSFENNSRQSIECLINECRENIGVASFALESNEHLWREYGGNGNGVCIEIDIPDHLVGNIYHQVDYVLKKEIHVDRFLKASTSKDEVFELFKNFLLTKTMEYEQEKEIRFIGDVGDICNVSKESGARMKIDGHISQITFGYNVPESTLKTLVTQINKRCKHKKTLIKKLP